MVWRVAYSLNRLLDQLNTLAPSRNKASDGSIGDTNHQNRNSDHNPWYGPGIVTARDFTHDPAKLNMHGVADILTAHRDPRIKYIIWNRRIWNKSEGWKAYTGSNPHTSHLHLSVVASPACDSTAAWAGFIPQPPAPPKESEVELTDDVVWGDGNRVPVKDILAEIYIAARGLRGVPAFAGQTDVVQLPPLVGIQASVSGLSDDEAKVLAEIRGSKSEVLIAMAAVDGTPSDEQVIDLAAKLRVQLGGAYTVSITPVAPTE